MHESKIENYHKQTNRVQPLSLAVMDPHYLDLCENPPPERKSTHLSHFMIVVHLDLLSYNACNIDLSPSYKQTRLCDLVGNQIYTHTI